MKRVGRDGLEQTGLTARRRRNGGELIVARHHRHTRLREYGGDRDQETQQGKEKSNSETQQNHTSSKRATGIPSAAIMAAIYKTCASQKGTHSCKHFFVLSLP